MDAAQLGGEEEAQCHVGGDRRRGLATVTPASGFVGPVSALAIGILAGLVTYFAFYLLNNHTKIDDTLGVWPAHGIGGLRGPAHRCPGREDINPSGNSGLFFGNPGQFGIQLLVDVGWPDTPLSSHMS